MSKPSYPLLRGQLEDIGHLNSTLALLHWDQEVHMPHKGSDRRAKTIGYLTALTHERFLELNQHQALSKLYRRAKKDSRKPQDVLLREVWRVYDRERKLPAAFVQELSELTSNAHLAWVDARRTSKYETFAPYLKRIVKLKKREAEYVGYRHSPYDALLDAYEPGLTSRTISVVFDELRDFLKKLVRDIRLAKHRPQSVDLFQGTFPLDQQQAFNLFVAQKMGFDFASGRMDVSAHPFTTQFHPQDVRITTRYRENDLLYSLGSTIHEVGHALYEQGLPIEHFGTPLGEAISLGIHESQSRVWENNIGKSRAFWTSLYPHLQKTFPRPFRRISFEDFYQTLNRVEPSLIRTEADEVTYNLHIILRYEIEKALIEGSVTVKQLPDMWNAKMKEYLGVRVPNDRVGVLQDVHWSGGSIGYFPTYALGNLYAAQFYHTALKQIPKLESKLKQGNFSPIREWLRKKIHVHGKTYTSASLVQEVTGESLKTKYFMEYLTKKYTEIYHLT